MIRVFGNLAFGLGVMALFGMLAIDVAGVRQVPVIWFGGLAMILAASTFLVPSLRPSFGRTARG